MIDHPLMIFFAMTFWMLVGVFSAYGICRLWCGVVNPKALNLALLPGTLVAQFGHATGVLLTGGNVDDIKNLLMLDMSNTKAKSKGSAVGSAITASLPIAMGGIVLYMMLMMSQTGWRLLDAAGTEVVSETLPLSMTAFWDWLRSAINLIESVFSAIATMDFNRLENWVLVYLLASVTVRLAPLPGTQRGAVIAILAIGAGLMILSLFTPLVLDAVQRGWVLGSFSIATLLLLLLVSVMVRAGIELFRLLLNPK